MFALADTIAIGAAFFPHARSKRDVLPHKYYASCGRRICGDALSYATRVSGDQARALRWSGGTREDRLFFAATKN